MRTDPTVTFVDVLVAIRIAVPRCSDKEAQAKAKRAVNRLIRYHRRESPIDDVRLLAPITHTGIHNHKW